MSSKGGVLGRIPYVGQLLQTIPGVGAMTASCYISAVGSSQDFDNGRNFATWLGLQRAENLKC